MNAKSPRPSPQMDWYTQLKLCIHSSHHTINVREDMYQAALQLCDCAYCVGIWGIDIT